jgi:hypothetical protein
MVTNLAALSAANGDPRKALRAYPGLFRRSLEEDNRMCLFSFMSAEHDDLPGTVKAEVQTFADVNVAWLTKMLAAASIPASKRETRARAIFAAVAGAQLMARSHADLKLFDALIDKLPRIRSDPDLNARRIDGSLSSGGFRRGPIAGPVAIAQDLVAGVNRKFDEYRPFWNFQNFTTDIHDTSPQL